MSWQILELEGVKFTMSESETDLSFRIQGISCGVVVHTINIKVEKIK